VVNFVIESNKIEAIGGYRDLDLYAHEQLLALNYMHIDALRDFVWTIAQARLRSQVGDDVRVGSHYPPLGGPQILPWLADIISDMNRDADPYDCHKAYETIRLGFARSLVAIW
jgi:hypothetical protein